MESPNNKVSPAVIKVLAGSMVLFLAIAIGGLLRKPAAPGVVAGSTAGPAINNNQELAANYQLAVKKIVANYQNDVDLVLTGNLAADREKWQFVIEDVSDKLLVLTVPKELMELHLDLVSAFSIINQGLLPDGDENKIKEGQEKLNFIIKNNPWLLNK